MSNRIHKLIETTEILLEQIEESYSGDLKIAKALVQDLRDELEELFEETPSSDN